MKPTPILRHCSTGAQLNLLLDSHVWLWWLMEREALSPRFLDAINSPNNRVVVSAISLWELNIKRQRGKLRVDADLRGVSVERGLEFIAFNDEHAEFLLSLPDIHKDPFDRALIAQAAVDKMRFLTQDAALSRYSGVVDLLSP